MDEKSRTRNLTTGACLIFLVLYECIASAAAQRSLDTDRQALERFRAAVDPTRKLLPWVAGTSPCTWVGVECYQNRVARLRLPGVQLTGRIPSGTLGDLDQLRVLSLHHNQLTGRFPADLARCTILHAIFLNSNFFTGPLPNFTGYWPRMTHFNVGLNDLSGPIPASISEFKDLNVLELQSNSFSGTIPNMSFVNLVKFSIANNQLVGSVPVSLRKFAASNFAGNGGLCGPPLRKPCTSNAPVVAPTVAAPVAVPVNAPIVAPAPIPVAAPAPSVIVAPSVLVPAPLVSATTPLKKYKLSGGAVAAIVISSLIVVIVIAFILCRPRRNNLRSVGKPARQYKSENVYGAHGGDVVLKDSHVFSMPSEPERNKLVFFDHLRKYNFGLEDLLRASAEVLGKGSVGTTYKAVLEGGALLAVKRLKDVAIGRKDFETHVEMLGKLHDKNLVPLRAYYFSKDERLLVSDYMPNGSLYALLHANRGGNRTPLDWVTRVKIALGSAKGLAYLHKEGVKFSHGNVKSSNILLNKDNEPCLADFALTQLLSHSTAALRLVGYRAPEVNEIRKVTPKSDVYSFGVLLLELLTGKAPMQATHSDQGIDLPKWVHSVVREEWTAEVFDLELIRYKNIEEEMVQMLQLALACVDTVPDRRPNMEEIVILLEDIHHLSDTGDESASRLSESDAKSKSSQGRDSQAGTPSYMHTSSGVYTISD